MCVKSVLQMKRVGCTLMAILFLAAASHHWIEDQVIQSEVVHLGNVLSPEWQYFESSTPIGKSLRLKFKSQPNESTATIFFRQLDVRGRWSVRLNGKQLGALRQMESHLIHTLEIPPGLLQQDNELTVSAPSSVDDILVGDIRIDFAPLEKALSRGRLQITVTEQGKPVPCRITITDQQGALAAVLPEPDQNVAFRPGVVYSGNGTVRLGIRPGTYNVYASRGFEYSVDQRKVIVDEQGPQTARLEIVREVPTPGMVSCDSHIHTLTHSGHGDSSMEERMLTIAGEGIELAIATDHNHHTDYGPIAKATRMSGYFTHVIGNEVTTARGHFNAFPIEPGSRVPDASITEWPSLLREIRATPGVQVVVLNHPRNVHSKFSPFAPENLNRVTGENLIGPRYDFDALEVVTSGALQSQLEWLFQDWFAILNHGERITAVGSSDTHDVSRYILGQARTYVSVPDSDASTIDVDRACQSLVEGRALVSMGLLVHPKVNQEFSVGDQATVSGRHMDISVEVLGPSWVHADKLDLYLNGELLKHITIEPTRDVVKARIELTVPKPPHDCFFVAIATGPGVIEPYWEIPRPYQAQEKAWNPRIIGASNPIWIDADGDGDYQSANQIAHAVIKQETTFGGLIKSLEEFDRAVIVQAASMVAGSSLELDQKLLEHSSEKIQNAFRDHIQQESTQASAN